jgi:hypothetical protein
MRVMLKGHGILAAPASDAERLQPRRLDGQALGRLVQRDGAAAAVGLILPSGGAAPASDFESWFFLGAEPAVVRPFVLDRLRFLFRNPMTGETTEQFRTDRPNEPEDPSFGRFAQRINVFEFAFSRPLRIPEAGTAAFARAVRIVNRDTGARFQAQTVTVSDDGRVLTLLLPAPFEGAPGDVPELSVGGYLLRISDAGDFVDRDGTPLDANADGTPGGTFDYGFRID